MAASDDFVNIRVQTITYLDLKLIQCFAWSRWHLLSFNVNILENDNSLQTKKAIIGFSQKKDMVKTSSLYLDL